MPYDWKTLRPLREWLIVKGDPRVKKTKGGIHLPDGQVMAERKMEGTGHIVAAGNPEAIRKVCGGVVLEPGMRIAYRGFLKDASADLFDTDDGCPVFMLSAKDVLAVIDETVEMGAFS